jgi:two-component system sensor histidine kinase KdpD
MPRGSLRIYLGAAPGVGKTYAMLGEGHRRKQRGADVVVGLVETHGRQQTKAQLDGLEVMPRVSVEYRGTTLQEMDVDAIVARHPDIVLVDEYAHTNAPGSRNEKRWQDVEALLDAGLEVISTLNVQHLESLNDVITEITGTVQRETVPDAIVRRADQIELVDMSPEALRRRMAHGNVYPAERIDAAMSNYFRPGNLGALRELALLWVADRVEESLATYLSAHGIAESWETRERIVVGITGRPGGDTLIRRAARMAGRVGGDLVGVHVSSNDGLSSSASSSDDLALLSSQRRLVEQLGGRVHDVVAATPAEGLVSFAHAEKATQLVLGASRRGRLHELLHGSFAGRVMRSAGSLDVHIIADHSKANTEHRSHPVPDTAHRRRRMWAWVLTVGGLPLLIAITVPFRSSIALTTELLIFLTVVLVIAAIGGRVVAATAAVVASLLTNWFFVEPYYTLTIAEPEHVVSLAVFVGAAISVGSLVDTASRRAHESQRARIEATALARSAATLAADPEALPRLIEQIRVTFGLDRVRLVPEDDSNEGYDTSSEPLVGQPVITVSVGDALVSDNGHRLELYGRSLSGDDQRVMRALADQLAVAIGRSQLGRDAAEAEALTQVDAVRTALLRAVSHDLRTPLASIKAMVSGLLDADVQWRPEQVRDALVTVDEEADRLNRLVGNLLDASRLQIGALAVNMQPVDMAESIAATLSSVGPTADRVDVQVPDGLPPAQADSALLERSLHNVVTNALHHAGDSPVRLTVGLVGHEIHICVVDRGPGISKDLRTKVMAPFQQLGDDRSADGVGLGMSIAQGFVQAMQGRLELDDTPGGGLTVIIALPAAQGLDAQDSPTQDRT